MSGTASSLGARRGGPALDGARLALAFLTVLPAGRVRAEHGAAWLSRAAPWFPLVGALVGGAAGGALALAAAAGVPASVAGGLAVVAAIVLTRGLHEDGLADTADGLGVHGGRARRLAAMRDSAVGAHGALALACAVLLAALALATLDAGRAVRALVAAHVAARAAMVLAAAALPHARAATQGGLGRSLDVTAPAAALATGLAGAIALAACGPRAAAVALAAGAAALLVALVVQRRALGGRTGDTLGATGKLVEIATLVALAGAWGR